MAIAASTQLNAVLVERDDVNDYISVMRFAPEGWEFEPFQAGQFAVLGLPGSAPRCADSEPEEKPAAPDRLIKRSYSIASSPLTRDHVEFYLIKVTNGALTPRLFALDVGDRVWMSKGAKGRLTLEGVADEARVAFLATGTGLAPFMSMLRGHLADLPRRKYLLAHGVRKQVELGYRAELEALAAAHPHFTYMPFVSEPPRPDDDWTGRRGRLDAAWTNGIAEEAFGSPPAPSDTHVYLCGNPLMVTGVTEILKTQGFDLHGARNPGQIHVEAYW